MIYFHDSFEKLQHGHPFNFHIFHNFIHLGILDLSQWVKVSYGDPSMYCHNARWCVFKFKHVNVFLNLNMSKSRNFTMFLHLTIKHNLGNKIHSYVLL